MGANAHPLIFQPLPAQAACDAQGGGQSAGEMATASRVLEAPVFDLSSVVGMAWPGAVFQILIIPGPGVGVADDGGDGCAGGEAVEDAREEFGPILLAPGVDQSFWPGARRFKNSCN